MGVSPIAVPQGLASALTSAGDKSGVDFGYLLQTALRESSLNPLARAPTSSAVGLFQFLDSTWLEVMKSDGGRLGYQRYADAIVERDGEYTIDDRKLRDEVLKLREDPQIAADLAAAFTRNNGEYLRGRFGRMPSPGELYIAHFLGAEGAAKLFEAGLSDPEQIAARLFPRQARTNPAIFYEQGRARTIREVYQALVAEHRQVDQPAASTFAAQQFAAQEPLPLPAPLEVPPALGESPQRSSQQAVPSRFTPADMSFTSLFATDATVPRPRTLLTLPEEPPAFATGLFGR